MEVERNVAQTTDNEKNQSCIMYWTDEETVRQEGPEWKRGRWGIVCEVSSHTFWHHFNVRAKCRPEGPLSYAHSCVRTRRHTHTNTHTRHIGTDLLSVYGAALLLWWSCLCTKRKKEIKKSGRAPGWVRTVLVWWCLNLGFILGHNTFLNFGLFIINNLSLHSIPVEKYLCDLRTDHHTQETRFYS